jgi:molybdopterin-biosynthesis enzyme MoeA-like protein
LAFGALIIGDEILSGKRQDKHLARVIETLGARGLELDWAQYIGDVPERITAALRLSFASSDVVFSFGGIGATPDDHTRQCAAAALGRKVEPHPEAVAMLVERFGKDVNAKRLIMATFPSGSAIIPNPYNKIAGFSVGSHYFLPGFPEMAWPMMEWVLDTHYAHLFHKVASSEESIIVHQAGESDLLDAMNAVLRDFALVKLSSLPQFVANGRIIELSIRGEPSQVAGAMQYFKGEVVQLGYRFDDQPPRANAA